MSRRASVRVTALLIVLSCVTLVPAGAAPGDTTRVSTYQGVPFSFDNDSTAISADGRWVAADDVSDQADVTGDGAAVAFSSRARNLISDDSNLGIRDVFVHEADAHAPARLLYTGPDRAFVGESIVVTAVLRDAATNAPMGAEQVRFDLREGGHIVSSAWARTDGAGLASTSVPATHGTGSFELVASFDGSLDHQRSSSVGGIIVTRHVVTAAYRGDRTGVPGRNAAVAARLTRESGAAVYDAGLSGSG